MLTTTEPADMTAMVTTTEPADTTMMGMITVDMMMMTSSRHRIGGQKLNGRWAALSLQASLI
jgi:hypothetical protein